MEKRETPLAKAEGNFRKEMRDAAEEAADRLSTEATIEGIQNAANRAAMNLCASEEFSEILSRIFALRIAQALKDRKTRLSRNKDYERFRTGILPVPLENPGRHPDYKKPLAVLGTLNENSIRDLQEIGVRTIKDLVQSDIDELALVRGVGEVRVANTVRELSKRGLAIRGRPVGRSRKK